MKLKALVMDNGLRSGDAFPDEEWLEVSVATTGSDFKLDLSPYDLLIVPNGADHVAMYRAREEVAKFLEAGKVVFCFCGWFTNWLPGNRWIHDNSKATKDMRHRACEDSLGVLEEVDLAALDFNKHGISGWWACGYIESQYRESVVIEDSWGRALLVADRDSTPGLMLLTASGPVGDYSRGRTKSVVSQIYRNMLAIAKRHLLVIAESPKS